MLDTVDFNHVQHISFTQSRLTDAVSVILSELLSYEHPPNCPEGYFSSSFPPSFFLELRENPPASPAPLPAYSKSKQNPIPSTRFPRLPFQKMVNSGCS